MKFCDRNDKLQEECGIVSLYNIKEATELSVKALLSLQHRGQQACGMYLYNEDASRLIKNTGLVSEVFKEVPFFSVSYDNAVGHVRYATSGTNRSIDAQPFLTSVNGKKLILAHNGHILNQSNLRSYLISEGQEFETNSDSEILLLYLKNNLEKNKSLQFAISELLHNISGAFSVVGVFGEVMFAFRDSKGFRPLVLGQKINPDQSVGYVIVSETCALEMIEATYTCDIKPGELCLIQNSKAIFIQILKPDKTAMCSFEYIYFSRSDSMVFEKSVYETRLKFGEWLAQEEGLELGKIDLVIAVPDSGTAAAIGYAQKLNKPFHIGLVKNAYVGRTFIASGQSNRKDMVKLKLNALQGSIRGKSIIVIDDSLVRGTTSHQIVEILKKRGAREVHLRIASPPIRYSCYFGVDTPEAKDLIANQLSLVEMNRLIGSHSLRFLSWNGYLNVLSEKNKYCVACFNGDYPLAISEKSFHNISYVKEKREILV